MPRRPEVPRWSQLRDVAGHSRGLARIPAEWAIRPTTVVHSGPGKTTRVRRPKSSARSLRKVEAPGVEVSSETPQVGQVAMMPSAAPGVEPARRSNELSGDYDANVESCCAGTRPGRARDGSRARWRWIGRQSAATLAAAQKLEPATATLTDEVAGQVGRRHDVHRTIPVRSGKRETPARQISSITLASVGSSSGTR